MPPRTLLAVTLALVGCRAADVAPSRVEATSLSGEPLERIEPGEEARAGREAELDEWRARWTSEGSEEAAIWVGRTLAYLGRYREAIDWYGRRLVDFPGSYRLLRHRGHRWISVREPARAVEDLSAAWRLCAELPDEVEPDGAPNRYGLERSTTQTNVLYHLGLAEYLLGDFEAAAETWQLCLDRCTNDDMRVATLNWLVHALRRAGRWEEARAALEPVEREMAVIENFAYHRILLLQKGLLAPGDVLRDGEDGVQDATAAYGVACWSLCNGNAEGARSLMERIVGTTPWNAFGHVAAEADLAREGR